MDLENLTTDSQMGNNYVLQGNRLSGKLSETYLEPLKHQIGYPQIVNRLIRGYFIFSLVSLQE